MRQTRSPGPFRPGHHEPNICFIQDLPKEKILYKIDAVKICPIYELPELPKSL